MYAQNKLSSDKLRQSRIEYIIIIHCFPKAFMLQIAPLAYVIMVVHVVVSKAFMLQIAPLAYVIMVVHVVVLKRSCYRLLL